MLTELVDVFYFQLSVSNHLKLLVGLLDPLFLPANRLSDGGSHLFACSFSFYCFHIDLILNEILFCDCKDTNYIYKFQIFGRKNTEGRHSW